MTDELPDKAADEMIESMRNREESRHTAREKLPDERAGVTIKQTIHASELDPCSGEYKPRDVKVYTTVGLYPDGRPGEVFVHLGQHGGTIGSLLDCLAIAISIGLQHGIPLETYLCKLERQRFEPSGRSNDPTLGHCASVVDAIARMLRRRFVKKDDDEG